MVDVGPRGIACVAGVRRGGKRERLAREAREDRTWEVPSSTPKNFRAP